MPPGFWLQFAILSRWVELLWLSKEWKKPKTLPVLSLRVLCQLIDENRQGGTQKAPPPISLFAVCKLEVGVSTAGTRSADKNGFSWQPNPIILIIIPSLSLWVSYPLRKILLDFAVGIIVITTNHFVMRMRCSSWLGSGQLKVNQRVEESNSINHALPFVAETRNIAGFIKILGTKEKYGEFQQWRELTLLPGR